MKVSRVPRPDFRRISSVRTISPFLASGVWPFPNPLITPSFPSAMPNSGSRADLSRARLRASSWVKLWGERMAVARKRRVVRGFGVYGLMFVEDGGKGISTWWVQRRDIVGWIMREERKGERWFG